MASSCAKYSRDDLVAGMALAAIRRFLADSMRISVDLPAPFGPTSAMRSPRSMCSERSSKTTSGPYAFRTCFNSSTVRPLFGAAGNVKCTFLRSGGTSIGTTFSSILMRLWTCAAFVA